MREILFRGKAVDADKWIYGDLRHISDERGGYILCIVDNTNGKNNDVTGVEVIPETVGQYTGSIDKNRTKIFEGDIVRAITRLTEIYVEVVTFKNGAFWYKNWSWVKFGFKFEKTEVIGNIYDNPELLGKAAKDIAADAAQSGLAPATENFSLQEA